MTRTSSTTRSTCWSRSPTRTTFRPRAWRWPGCAAGRGSRAVIVGARTDEQLADNLAAAELELSADEAARLEEVSRPPLLYPYWHQRKTAADRLSSADLSLIGPYLEPSRTEEVA